MSPTRAEPVARATAGATYSLPGELDRAVRAVLLEWRAAGKMQRLWRGDASLWTDSDEARWLGWLAVVRGQLAQVDRLVAFADEVRRAGFRHTVLLGMGGSSLCPHVLARTFGPRTGYPELLVLDSTDPAQVTAIERAIDLPATLFIVSSKSGTTREPDFFRRHFFDRVARSLGEKSAGERFIAITDPGSRLEATAEADGFRRVFHGLPDIGGRYSALSDFGTVPAALLGLDVRLLLVRATEMAEACGPEAAPENPGLVLGAVLGTLAARGRDKVTVVASPAVESLGAWLEQLLAESTGKAGRGLIPVDRERLGPVEAYGDDRLFVQLRLESQADPHQDASLRELESAGHPVVRISLADAYDLGREFFRWEIATAVAGAILGINPFDQPDVEASKVATRALTDAYERDGALPPESPFLEADGVKLFADPANASRIRERAGGDLSLAGALRAHLGSLGAGDYLALLAYLEMSAQHDRELQALRHSVRDAKRVATCLGYGPRFLHSTGQAYKGGPDTGVFLQVTCDDAHDLPVPDRSYTFGVVKAAQARGDLQVLAGRGRRALRAHLGPDVPSGLVTLREAAERALRARD